MICCCDLAGTVACKRCNRHMEYFGETNVPQKFNYNMEYDKIREIIKEELDKHGNKY